MYYLNCSILKFYFFFSCFSWEICWEIPCIKEGKKGKMFVEETSDGSSLANRDLMSHLASEIDSGAIRRVNCTRLLVVARWARAARRAYLSIK